jgi:hypothetical protein
MYELTPELGISLVNVVIKLDNLLNRLFDFEIAAFFYCNQQVRYHALINM